MVAEERKALNYSELGATYTFMVVAIETSGVFRHNSIKCLKELGRRLCEATGGRATSTHLLQRLAVDVQHAWECCFCSGNYEYWSLFVFICLDLGIVLFGCFFLYTLVYYSNFIHDHHTQL